VTTPQPITDKPSLRQAMRSLPRGQDSAAICTALGKWLHHHPEVRVLAAYSALPGEVDLSELIHSRPDLTWLYPKVTGHELSFHPGGNLRPGSFGILEPDDDSPAFPLSQIHTFLCPGLAFDPQGGRLGRGRGFYDRLLAQASPQAHKLGICFPQQMTATTFPEAHDIAMDAVICGEI
jgi:5-formyltetrahydrofolate cyclo-ligase